jgi:hypothetical protein
MRQRDHGLQPADQAQARIAELEPNFPLHSDYQFPMPECPIGSENGQADCKICQLMLL